MQVEVKVVARVVGRGTENSDGDADARTRFWQELQQAYLEEGSHKRAQKLSSDDLAPDGGESRLAQAFEHNLARRILDYFRSRSGLRFRRLQRILGRDDYSLGPIRIRLRHIRYGSIDMLLQALIPDALRLSEDEILELLELYIPETLAEAFDDRVWFDVDVQKARGPRAGDVDRYRAPARSKLAMASLSLLVPVVLTLVVCTYVFLGVVEQLRSVQQERELLLTQWRALDERRQMLFDDLIKARSANPPAAGASGATPPGGTSPPEPAPRDQGSDGTRPGTTFVFNPPKLEDVAAAVRELVKTTPGAVESLARSIAEGAKAASETARAVQEVARFVEQVVDLYRRLFPAAPAPSKPDTTEPKTAQPPSPPSIGAATLFDTEVDFRIGSADIEPVKDKLLAFLKGRSIDEPVLIEGHADGRGAAAPNIALSLRRAEAVKQFLIDNQVSAHLLHVHGYGQGYYWQPFNPLGDKNRRVRIVACRIAGEDRCAEAKTVSR